MAIEVELRFSISAAPEKLADYPLVKEADGLDVYYDTAAFGGYGGGNFLRVRDGRRIDFKLDCWEIGYLFCKEVGIKLGDLAAESAAFNDAIRVFGSGAGTVNGAYADFDDVVRKNNLVELCRIAKHRRVYQITSEIKIMLDQVENIGLFMECEIMRDGDVDNEIATRLKDKMIAELESRGLLPSDARPVNVGYVELYLYRNNREAFELGKYKDV